MDADQAGYIATEKFTKKLGEDRTWVVDSRKNDPNGPKDANDCLKEGKDLNQYINNAKLLASENIISLTDIKNDVVQFLNQFDSYIGYKSNYFSFFNSKLKGLRMGEFTVLTGETGSGKTTFLAQLSLDFLLQVINMLNLLEGADTMGKLWDPE